MEVAMFSLDARLRQDTVLLGCFPLSLLLLMNDANYPWFILVPQRVDIREIHELSNDDQSQLLRESSHLSRRLSELFKADKMNVAALGNVVSQLHIHHVVRYRGDAAWPAPVWGRVAATPYSPEQIDEIKERLLGSLDSFTSDE